MIRRSNTIYIFSLLQDVTVLRPLIYLAHDDFGAKPILVTCPKFRQRDKTGIWQSELSQISEQTEGEIISIRSTWELWQRFCHEKGALFLGNESELSNHDETRELVRCAPKGFITVALQHGYECVGFLMNQHQIQAHGNVVRMESDLLCSWLPVENLRELCPTSQSRVIHTGPSTLIKNTTKRVLVPALEKEERKRDEKIGLICENLHSVRFGIGGETRSDFLEVFDEFAAEQEKLGNKIALRPHPAGQYMLRNSKSLPRNVILELRPTYKIDWSQYRYGISAPSSVLIDMVANGLSAAAWIDDLNNLDTSNYGAIPKVCTLEDWMRFSHTPPATDAALDRLLPGVTPETCTTGFRAMLQLVLGQKPEAKQLQQVKGMGDNDPLGRLIFICDDPQLPTLQICLLGTILKMHPTSQPIILSPTRRNKDLAATGLDKKRRQEAILKILEMAIDQGATSAVFCRYVGPFHLEILDLFSRRNIKSYYFIDDLLTNVPEHIGLHKKKRYESTQVRGCLFDLLNSCDHVVTSNSVLAKELSKESITPNRLSWLGVSCSGRVNLECDQNFQSAQDDEVVIGYMGFDHDADFEPIAASLAEILDRHRNVRFELIGPLRLHPELELHSERVTMLKPIYNYHMFMSLLASRRWHIGLAPLLNTRFNRCKSINKWIEYTSCGVVTVASAGVIYDHVCSEGGGLLAATPMDWVQVLSQIVRKPDLRITTLQRARAIVEDQFSSSRHYQCLKSAFLAGTT